MRIYESIYEEASAVFLGRAFKEGKGALIIEPTLHPAKEYIESMRPCRDASTQGALSSCIRETLLTMEAIKDGMIHPQSAEHVLIREIGKSGAEILFLTRLISAHYEDGLWYVRVFCLNKEQTFICRHFYPKSNNTDKRYYAFVRENESGALEASGLQFFQTIYPHIFIINCPVCSLYDLRRRVSIIKGITVMRFPSVACEYNAVELFSALDSGEMNCEIKESKQDIDRVGKEIQQQYDCDVLVVGTGTAGTIAAIAASQDGAKVIAADRLPFAGGLISTTVFSYYYGARGGLYERVDEYAEEIAKSGIAAPGNQTGRLNPISQILAYDRIFEKEKIQFIGDALLYSVIKKDRTIQGVRLLTPNGFIEIKCRFVIDGTSENHLCSAAGCSFHIGREFDHKTQPFSYVTSLCMPDNPLPCMHTSDFGYTDAGDAIIVSQNILNSAGKLQLPTNVVHLGVSNSIGAREGRCINGVSHLNWSDFFYQQPVDRPVTYGLSNMDDHGKDMAFESRMHADWMVGMSMWGTTVRLQVPMGALIPKEFDNCTVAGRNIDMDHDCASHLRMMRDLRRIGEASGRIAALAIENNCAANDIPYETLRARLLESGCLSDLSGPDVWDTKPAGGAVPYPSTDAEAHHLMESDKPGLAILYLLRSKKAAEYKRELNSSNEWLRFNSACLLALDGMDEGKEILRTALITRDKKLPETSRKYNMTRGITALYLLGRLSDKQSLQIIKDIICEDTLLIKYAVPSDEFFYRDEDTRFAYLSHAVRAIIEIGNSYPNLKPVIITFLHDKFDDPDFHTYYSLKTSKNVVQDGSDELRKFIEFYNH